VSPVAKTVQLPNGSGEVREMFEDVDGEETVEVPIRVWKALLAIPSHRLDVGVACADDSAHVFA
jgi:hypothetical protein